MIQSNTLTKRQKFERMRAALEEDRASFIPTWREVAEYMLPRRPRFFTNDVNKGDRRTQKIIDSVATQALGTLMSGMMSGITSPARPWFKLTVSDKGLVENHEVKQWLSKVEDDMREIFLRSNLYNVLPVVYGDMGGFATGAMFCEEDFDSVLRFYALPIGSYMIGVDAQGRVNVLVRDLQMTIVQLIEKFGVKNAKGEITNWENFSLRVKTAYESGNLRERIDVAHVVAPNEEYDEDKLESKYKKFTSCYYERSASGTNVRTDDNNETLLRESGYDHFPLMAPRWEVNGEDSWGTNSPGIRSLGDVKALQIAHKRLAQAIEKMVNPPMVGTPDLEFRRVSALPGELTISSNSNGKDGLRPVYQVDPRVGELSEMIVDLRRRIKKSFYEDVILIFAESDREMTKYEAQQKQEEKLWILGPVLQQTDQDLLKPLIDMTFEIMLRQNRIPPPPEALEGMDIKVEYISVMAQAQKMVGVSGIERFVKFALESASLAQDPTMLDKVDFDQTFDVYGDMTSVPIGVIRTDEAVAEMRQARAKAQQQQQQAQDLAAAAKGAKDLAGADLETDNALSRVLQQGQPAA